MINDTDDLTIFNDELRRMRLAKVLKQKISVQAIPSKEESKFFKIDQILALVPIGRSTLYNMIAAGEFPKQKKLSRNNSVWNKEEVNAWINEKLSS